MNDGWIRRISNFEMKTHLNQSGGGLRNLESKYSNEV